MFLLSASFFVCTLLSLEREAEEVDQARQVFVVVCRVYSGATHFVLEGG